MTRSLETLWTCPDICEVVRDKAGCGQAPFRGAVPPQRQAWQDRDGNGLVAFCEVNTRRRNVRQCCQKGLGLLSLVCTSGPSWRFSRGYILVRVLLGERSVLKTGVLLWGCCYPFKANGLARAPPSCLLLTLMRHYPQKH